jgi:3-hydroxyacyl-CoA dehydrogenase/enoyl-CoA hydratase/3-hydroxybutyryl-CoA epimerase/3-hydroxyacyl-CoA dehydrogenase/enoyl-CoA hydratase/3-hydroxybutyryl-CoA epimerase/enoyl-CoA isomerase
MTAIAGDLRTLAIERTADGFAVLSFVVPDHRHNVITPRVVEELAAVLAELAAAPPPGVVLRSGKPGSFFAGADLGRLAELRGLGETAVVDACDRGRRLFARLSESFPTAAVIDGACLGGGLELALACDLRLATPEPHTQLGCPEVKLGLLPGWGGTVRLPRLIGIGAAIELAAAGESVDAATAVRLGLVDACVPAASAVESACRLLAARTADGAVARRRSSMAAAVVIDPVERDFLEATTAALMLGRTGGHYPAPPVILETVLAGAAVDAAAAARIESAAFARLAATPVAGNLLRVFGIGDRNRRDPGIGDAAAAAAAPVVAKPAVVGAGIMGSGIAARHLRCGFPLTLVDVDAAALEAAVPVIVDEAAWDRVSGRADPAVAVTHAARLRSATTLAAVAGADLVIESVTERPDVKQRVLADIERVVGPETVIATNTSTNPIGRLAAGLTDPSRFCGMHFFNPVRRMMLVEVVRGPATSDRTVAAVVAHAKRLGKVPVVVNDSPGFLVNRILMPYLHEAGELLREGVPAERIDRVARGFGMPLGPIELYDMVGLDTAFYAGLVLSAAFGDRIEASPVIPALVKAGRLGRKTGAGFYRHSEAGQQARVVNADEKAAEIIARYAHPPRESSDRVIVDRLFLPMLLEALRVLDEKLVRDAASVDLGVIHALGFPAFRGGLLAWADSLGAAEVVRRLEPLAELGPRMHPVDRLLSHAASGRPFTE